MLRHSRLRERQHVDDFAAHAGTPGGQYVEDLELSYYGAPSRDIPAAWYEQWLEASVMPELVRVHVSFPPGDARTWPDLIVRPITDAASAIF